MLKFLKKWKDFLLLTGVVFIFLDVNAQENQDPNRFEFSHSSMGSLFTIIGYGSDSILQQETAKAAFLMVDRLNLIMSDYNPESELMKLCRTAGQGEYIPVSGELFAIIQESQRWSVWSGGIFDITVGAYSQLWRRAGRKDQIPDSSQLEKAASVVGYHDIQLDTANHSVKLVNPGMQLDLGGIAKGYTVDKIFNLFRNNGFDTVLVNGGGDIRVGENPPGTQGWKIRIENENGRDSISFLSNCAIATSGDLYRFTEINGVRYSHIIDPFTGFGITIPRTVTITAPACMEADVLASILSISGARVGFGLLKNLKDVNALIVEVEKDGKKILQYSSP